MMANDSETCYLARNLRAETVLGLDIYCEMASFGSVSPCFTAFPMPSL